MNRLVVLAWIISLQILPSTAFAQQPTTSAAEAAPPQTLAGGVTPTSQYRIGGITLSDEEVTLQDTLTINPESRLYAGIWASSLHGLGDLSAPVSGTLITLVSHLGWPNGDTPLSPGDYFDWSLNTTANWQTLAFGLSYVDTNIKAAEAYAVGGAFTIVDAAVVALLTASF